MRTSTLSLAALVSVLALSFAPHSALGDWVLEWSDEFDDPAINTTNWNVLENVTEGTPPHWNQIELYRAENAYIQDGNLVLRTRLENITYQGISFNVTSGRVDSSGKRNFTYGKFVVGAKLQAPEAIGIHTAHWLLGEGCWPVYNQAVEIDIMEMEVENISWVKSTSNYHGAEECSKDDNHIGAKSFPGAGQGPVDFHNNYQEFSVEWNETSLVYAVNGTVFNSYYVGMKGWENVTIPSTPLYWILSQAYMAWRRANPPPEAWPVLQFIDYVRVFKWV